MLIESLSRRLTRYDQETKLRREQLSEAFRLMEAGQMEFEDYLRFRDAHLNHVLEGLELKLKLWEAKSSLARYTGNRLVLCGEPSS